jgi:hypothetical protein
MSEWERLLLPCPTTPEPIASYVFFVNSLSETKAKIIEVLDKYNMPHVAFPDDDHLITCRMRFVFDRSDNTVIFQLDLDHIRIDFSQSTLDHANKRAMEIIEFAIELLREMQLVSNENEAKVRESMIRSWSEWIEVPKAILPILLGKLMSKH